MLKNYKSSILDKKKTEFANLKKIFDKNTFFCDYFCDSTFWIIFWDFNIARITVFNQPITFSLFYLMLGISLADA